MNNTRIIISLIMLLAFSNCGHAQKKSMQNAVLVGGRCEGCEAVFEYGDKTLSPVDTLPDFNRPGPKLRVTGTIYQADGKTPALNVILYIYHTNQKGVYETRGDETGWARRHGRIRGWVKTGVDGQYTFYTLIPGHYPNRASAAHIHPTILEPGGKYYWLGSYLFEGDSLLTDEQKNEQNPWGGGESILHLHKEDGLWVGKRDIVLGLNIPGYE